MSLIYSFVLLFFLLLFIKNRVLLFAISLLFVSDRLESSFNFILLLVLILSGQLAAEAIVKHRKLSKTILLSFNIVSILLFFFFKTQADDVNMISNLTRTKMPFGFSVLLFVINGYLIELYYDPRIRISWRSYFSELLFYPRLIIGPIYHLKKAATKELVPEKKDMASLLSFFLISFGLFQFALSGIIGSSIGSGYIISSEQLRFYRLNPLVLMISATVFLYLNFSGFSYIVMGLCKMTNREPVSNFQFPFGSQTMKIFWNHWHMSLGKWFQQFVYFPLQSRLIRRRFLFENPKVLNFICSFFVFLAIGAWHDVSLKMFLWSLLNTVAVSFVNFKNKWLGIVSTNAIVLFICGLFMSKSVDDYLFLVKKTFTTRSFFYNGMILSQVALLAVSLGLVYFLERFTLRCLDENWPEQSRLKLFLYTYLCLVVALTLGLSNIDLTYDGF